MSDVTGFTGIGSPDDCECGGPPTLHRFHTGYSWMFRIYCEPCEVQVGPNEDCDRVIVKWNKIQSALRASR